MALELVAISGSKKGTSWALTGEGLVMGREADCGIIVNDPVVSRRHCRLTPSGSGVEFEDLGSLNLALVNGVPTKTDTLHAGDEIALGRERFLLVDATGVNRIERLEKGGTDTWPWSKGNPLTLDVDTAKPVKEARPGTVEDLVLLFEVNRELSSSASLQELVTNLRKRLQDRFNPQALWVAFAYGQEELTLGDPIHGPGQSDADAPMEAMRKALRERRGLLAPSTADHSGQKVPVFTLVCPVVLRDVALAVLAVQTQAPHGAYDEEDLRMLVLLGQSLAPLLCAVENLERLKRDNERLRVRAGESISLVGESEAIREVQRQLSEAAATELNVLITGETGTGKELVARLLHAQSSRSARPLVTVNCAAIPRDLFESQLFGYEKGAFTGAVKASTGLFAEAHRGILFLDEVGDLSLENQARILRAIENGTFHRIGAKEETRVDVRVIAATNRDIPGGIRANEFREDLYHRLNAFEIVVPPLRERTTDISILANHFFQMYRGQAKRPLAGFSAEAMAHLQKRQWPGNVRELRNCVQRAVSLARGDDVSPEDVRERSEAAAHHQEEEGPPVSLADLEKRHIERTLAYCDGHVRNAARMLGIGRSTLYKKLNDYGIPLPGE